jgi:hypothetical protein
MMAKRIVMTEVADGRFGMVPEPKQAARGENSCPGTRGSNAIRDAAVVLGF